MTAQMLLCPGCRARVLENWAECKFCGERLTSEPIAATVHPDDLAAPSPSAAPAAGAPLPPPPGAAPSADGHYDWSEWVNEPAAPVVTDAPAPPDAADDFDYPVPPEPPDWDAPAADTTPGPSSWDEAPQEQAGLHSVAPTPEPPMAGSAGLAQAEAPGWGAAAAPDLPPPPAPGPGEAWQGTGGDAPGAALEPLQGAGSQWASGPAPVVPDADDGSAQSGSDPAWQDDLGPSGLDPVSWYDDSGSGAQSPASPTQDDRASSGPSLFGDRTGGAGAAAGAAAAGQAADAFDAGAIFRDEPATAGGGTLERQAPAGPVAVTWQPAADAWNAPAEPEGTPKGQPVLSREVRLLAFGILALVVIGLLARTALERQNSYPTNWTPDVQGVAAWVVHERGLPFKHPVPVRTVDANEYARELQLARSAGGAKATQALADRVAMLRALGAVEGNPTGAMGPSLLTDADSGAFYDVRKNRLVLRAGTNAARLNVSVAGALSVALDDQYGDLSDIASTSLSEVPHAAVVAGGADLVRADYLAAQPGTVQLEVAAQAPPARPIGPSFEAARAKLEVGTGHALAALVRDLGSTDDVNQMNVVPPSSDLQVIDPTVYLNGQRALVVDTPEAPAGATTIDSGTIGASTWYLLVAARLDPERASSAIEAWSGDSFVAYREANGRVCISDVLRGADDTAAGTLLDTLTDWRDQVPGGLVKKVVRDGELVSVTACDPGASAKQGLTEGYDRAVRAAVTRSALTAMYYHQGTKVPNGPNGPIFTPTEVWCMASRVVSEAHADELADLAVGKGSRYQSLTLQAGGACGSNLVGQLFRSGSGG